jgi:hypothetical protein
MKKVVFLHKYEINENDGFRNFIKDYGNVLWIE